MEILNFYGLVGGNKRENCERRRRRQGEGGRERERERKREKKGESKQEERKLFFLSFLVSLHISLLRGGGGEGGRKKETDRGGNDGMFYAINTYR